MNIISAETAFYYFLLPFNINLMQLLIAPEYRNANQTNMYFDANKSSSLLGKESIFWQILVKNPAEKAKVVKILIFLDEP